MSSSCFIYVLQLKGGKYYIGRTSNPHFRVKDHFNRAGTASMWTKKYSPETCLELVENCDVFDEDKYTIKYMVKYGINNVRGGSFCQINLSDGNIATLQQIIRGVTDKCYICGRDGHFAVDCRKHTTPNNILIPINLNEKCDCPSSRISSHRKGKCLFRRIKRYFDKEEDDIDKYSSFTSAFEAEAGDDLNSDQQVTAAAPTSSIVKGNKEACLYLSTSYDEKEDAKQLNT